MINQFSAKQKKNTKDIPCKYGVNCKYLFKRQCKFHHTNQQFIKTLPCKFGEKCLYMKIQQCKYFHPQGQIKLLSNNTTGMSSQWQKFVNKYTFGLINPTNAGLIIKSPISAQKHKENIQKNEQQERILKQGVWIGKKPILGFGYNGPITEYFNVNFEHYAFIVDGWPFHLKTKDGNFLGLGGYIEVQPLDYSVQYFQWHFKGQAKRKREDVKKLINKLNQLKLKYILYGRNCIYVAKSFSKYAMGVLDEQQVLKIMKQGHQVIDSTINS